MNTTNVQTEQQNVKTLTPFQLFIITVSCGYIGLFIITVINNL